MNSDMEGRLSSAETAIKGLAESMQSLAHTVNVGFDRINDRIGLMSRPNYTLLVSIVGLAAVLGGGAVTWYDRDYVRLNGDIQKTSGETLHLGKAMAVAEYRLNQVQVSEKELDTNLQREMRLLDDKTAAQVVELDRRLQGEIRVVDAASKDRRDKSLAETNSIQQRIDVIGPEVAKFAERIDNARTTTAGEIERLATQIRDLNAQHKALAAMVDSKISELRKEAVP